MDKQKIINDLNNSIIVLASNLNLFRSGTTQVYIVIANELRKLICDKNLNNPLSADNSLLKKAFTGIRFHPMRNNEPYPNPKTKTLMRLPGLKKVKKSTVSKGAFVIEEVTNLFDLTLPTIELDNWLKQEILIAGPNKGIAIADLIKSISDKEGAHSDNHYNETLLMADNMPINMINVKASYIVAIGSYVFDQIQNDAKRRKTN